MNFKMLSTTILAAMLFAFGCASDDNSPTAPPATQDPPPTFSMASVNLQCNDGSDCIQFSTRPSKDVVLVKVVIERPAGNSITFNLGSSTVIAGEDIGLQDDNSAYFRISGEWKFTFTGNLATGDKSSFEVTAVVNVSA